MGIFNFWKKSKEKKEPKENYSEILSLLKNKKVIIFNKVYRVSGVQKLKGQKGILFVRKTKKNGKIEEEKYFLPFAMIYTYDGECINDKEILFINKKKSIFIYAILYILSFFFVSFGYFLLLSVIVAFFTVGYYKTLFRIKFFLQEKGEIIGFIKFYFEDQETVCGMLQVLKAEGLSKGKIIKNQKASLSSFFKVIFKEPVDNLKKEIEEVEKTIINNEKKKG